MWCCHVTVMWSVSTLVQGIIELILATDMARHGEFMDNYKQCLSSGFDVKNEEHLKTVHQSDFNQYVMIYSRVKLTFRVFILRFVFYSSLVPIKNRLVVKLRPQVMQVMNQRKCSFLACSGGWGGGGLRWEEGPGWVWLWKGVFPIKWKGMVMFNSSITLFACT